MNDAKKIAERLLDIIGELESFLTEENDLLTQKNYLAVAENSEKKATMFRDYESALRKMAENKDEIDRLEEDDFKKMFLAKAEAFQDLLKKNHFALKGVSLSAKRVAERITRAVYEKVAEQASTYDNKGLVGSKTNKNNNTATVTDGAY